MTTVPLVHSPTVDEFRERVRSWLAEHVPRKTPFEPFLILDDAGVDRDRAIQRELWAGRIAGVQVPVEYGGLGLSADHELAFREEAADYRMPEVFGNAHNVALPTLLAHGSEYLKSTFIPRILSGEHVWCQLLSEPSGGSDLAGALTRAVRDGDEFILNGAKIWTTAGNYSDYGLCLARTNPDAPKHAGLTLFVVSMHQPGMTVRPLVKLDGEADFCQEFLDDVVVPVVNVIGEVNGGWGVATTLMMNERTAIGRGWSLGGRPGQGEGTGLDLNPELLDTATKLGRLHDPVVRALIGESWTLTAVQARTTARVSAATAGGELPGPAAALLKGMAGVLGRRSSEIAAEVAGQWSAVWSIDDPSPWGMYRLSTHGIGGGTTEMQLNGIAERLLELPREPSPDRELPFNQVRRQ